MRLVISLLLPLCFSVFGQGIHRDVRYGPHHKQVYDLYQPQRPESRVFVFIHGGGWWGGEKRSMERTLHRFSAQYPHASMVNMNYRLGNVNNPGYPKQIEDLQAVIRSVPRHHRICLVGGSAGAHLAMLYSYMLDRERRVEAIVNIVGPTDLTIPVLVNPLLDVFVFPLLGPRLLLTSFPLYKEVSPTTWVDRTDPPTISFYGRLDPFVVQAQGRRLESRLNENRVPNELVYYPGGHFVDWLPRHVEDMFSRIWRFLGIFYKP